MADLSAPLYDSSGTEIGEAPLDADLFGVEPNQAVMHQAAVAYMAGRRSGTAQAKSRSEVRGGGRKPWRQKGLGRSRHGSIRSPLWVGGGSAHPPRPRSYAQRTPKKMRGLALRSALSSRAAEGAVKVVEDFEWEAPRTRRAAALLAAIGANGKALVVLTGGQDAAEKSFRNLPQVILGRAGRLNVYDVLWSDTVVFSGSALSYPDPFVSPETSSPPPGETPEDPAPEAEAPAAEADDIEPDGDQAAPSAAADPVAGAEPDGEEAVSEQEKEHA